ncbi:MAG: hypothetical protein K5790_01670 [Nitrosopumilus sp.]|uniref:hypothetical protein n=1 Tax=Nitrosopumilus sp. TaxID=2024843 RepID=UPI00247CE0EC|nr:hypothetical protein [Nitrosopumilus sp.]MCV0391982.1 hypothetical protein [Nitrosopumilus sp.]
MATRLLENLRKRIILVILGIITSYFGIIPLGIFYHMLVPSSLPDPLSSYFFFNSMRIGIMVLFLYFALVYVKPSLVPKQEKYKKLVLLVISVIVILVILLPSGYVIPQLEQGGCTTKSGNYNDDGDFRGSSSQGVTTESECIDNCIFSGKFNTREEKFCEFHGMFGKTHWMRTPGDFDTPVFGEIIKRKLDF